MKPRELDKILRDAGWSLQVGRGKGSHRVYKHPNQVEFVTVPWHPGRDIAPGIVRDILKQAGLR